MPCYWVYEEKELRELWEKDWPDSPLASLTRSDLDLLGRAVEPDRLTRLPVQGDMWGDDRSPKPRRDHPGQELIAGCETATVCEVAR